MKTLFIFGGGKYDNEVAPLAESFVRRVARYGSVDTAFITSKAKEEEQIRKEESSLMLRQIGTQDFVILFDERGKEISSKEYAVLIDRLLQTGVQRLVVIVGGAHGVSDEVRVRANYTIAFSAMIFPHQLARVMALEQLYRARSIIAGSKYHHE